MKRERSDPRQGNLFAPPASAPAAPVSLAELFSDSADREQAVTVFDRPILLAAGAGTGKTGTLTARIATWCLGPGWEEARARAPRAAPEDVACAVLGGVVAITFTEAAAAEMSARVAEALAAVELATAGGRLAPEHLPRGLVLRALPGDARVLQERAGALRVGLDTLVTSTIHAFCRRLLSTHCLAAGLDPSFTVDAAGTRAALAVREVLEEELRAGWNGIEPGDLATLARRGIGPTEIERELVELIDAGARARDFAGAALDRPACERLLARLEAPLALLAGLAPRLETAGHNTPYAVEALARTAALFAELRSAAPRARIEALCARLPALWNDKATGRLKKWKKGDEESLTKAEARLLGADGPAFLAASRELAEALAPLLELDPAGLEAARRTAECLLARVEERLRASGAATFGDLLFEARRLLVEQPEIAAAERARMRQLLVDEFQDTDQIQCDIVRALGLEGPASGRPALFLVGDPKQSIFAWRNADLAAFDGFAEELRRAGGLALALTRNFRSRPAILAEVERTIAPCMERVHGVQPGFAPLEAHRPAGAGPGVEVWVSWTLDERGQIDARPRGKKLQSYESEARALATDLLRQHGRDGLAWADVAVIFRGLTEIEPYLRALREHDIPYEVQSDRRYYQRREVIDAGALVRAVLDPHDHLALVTLLRSPLVGVPDAALFPLWERGFPGRMSSLRAGASRTLAALEEDLRAAAAALPGSIPGLAEIAGWEEGACFAVRAIARLRRSFRELPADAWVAELRALFLPEPLEAARYLGAWRLANLQRFFRDLLRALEERGGDLQSVLRTLRANLARDDRSEAARPADSGRDAVKILTIHGAKGLEFRHVYLPQLHKGEPEGDRVGFDRRAERISYRVLGMASPAWFETRPLRETTEAAERVRLLYVALTRAADRLVVMGSFPLERRPRSWRQAGNFLELYEQHPALPAALAALSERVERDERRSFVDEAGVVWTATLWIEGERRILEQEEAPRTPETEIERDADALARARATAGARAARPWQGRPSEEGHHERHERRAAAGSGEESAAPLTRDEAQAAGTVVHRALERLELDLPAAEALARARAGLADLARGAAEGGDSAPVLARATELWERFAAGPLCARLFALREQVIARELPVLLPPPDAEAGPVGFLAGALDLVYRDPAGGELVVVDFKTDRVESAADVAVRAASYRIQGALYARALREALALDYAPRVELWFLHAGEVSAP